MQIEQRHFSAGIVDFNLKKMDEEMIRAYDIHPRLIGHFGDLRQYAPTIARHFPDSVEWFDTVQPWFFKDILDDSSAFVRLMNRDVLIMSGSGQSAYAFQEATKYEPSHISPEHYALSMYQELVKYFLAQGKWVWGDCYGGQLGMHAIGGTLGRLPKNNNGNTITEAGWLMHELTEAGRHDSVFGDLSDTFYAPHLHNDYVDALPSVGHIIQSNEESLIVTRSEVLALRNGYLGRNTLRNKERQYIHAAVVEFTNGARFIHTQFHPEMATENKWNFLTRQNDWIAKDYEMGQKYYEKALQQPEQFDFSVSQIIFRFVEEARKHREETEAITFSRAMAAYTIADFNKYLIA